MSYFLNLQLCLAQSLRKSPPPRFYCRAYTSERATVFAEGNLEGPVPPPGGHDPPPGGHDPPRPECAGFSYSVASDLVPAPRGLARRAGGAAPFACRWIGGYAAGPGPGLPAAPFHAETPPTPCPLGGQESQGSTPCLRPAHACPSVSRVPLLRVQRSLALSLP